MTVPFSEVNKKTGDKTMFIEKIWQMLSLNGNMIGEYIDYKERYNSKFGKDWDSLPDFKFQPKLTTIRRDENNRYQPGKLIHPFINSRQPSMFQFAPAFPIVSTQKIVIDYCDSKPNVYIDGEMFYFHTRRNTFGDEKMLQLALNDGFNSINDFFRWFSEDFTGVVIHFTDLRY